MLTSQRAVVSGHVALTPTPSSFATPAVEESAPGPAARVLFDFTPTSPFELTVSGESHPSPRQNRRNIGRSG